MALPGGTRRSRVSVKTIAGYDRACGDGSVQKGVAALGSAGQGRIDQAGRGPGRHVWRDAVGGRTAVAELAKICGEAGAVGGLIDDLRSIYGTQGGNRRGFVGSHARADKIGDGNRRDNQNNDDDNQQFDQGKTRLLRAHLFWASSIPTQTVGNLACFELAWNAEAPAQNSFNIVYVLAVEGLEFRDAAWLAGRHWIAGITQRIIDATAPSVACAG